MPPTNPDANSELASSATPPTGAQPAADPNAPPKEPSLADIGRQAFDEHYATSDKGEKQEGSQGQNLTQTDADKKVDGLESKAADPASVSQEKPVEGQQAQAQQPVPDDKLPFHEHPRWKEVLNQRNEYEQKVKQYEPTVKEWQAHNAFIQRFGITPQEVAQAMSIMALQKTDPAKAREMLKPIWEQLQEFDENRISPEIQALVDANEMTPTAAKQYAKLQAQLKAAQRGTSLTAEQQQRQVQQSIGNAISSWDLAKRQSDPDFVPKKAETDPDGLWEMTAAKFAYLQTVQFASDPMSTVRHLEKAYADSKAVLSRYATARTPTKVSPNSRQSASSPKKRFEDMTTDEVVAAEAAKHGIVWHGRHSAEEE